MDQKFCKEEDDNNSKVTKSFLKNFYNVQFNNNPMFFRSSMKTKIKKSVHNKTTKIVDPLQDKTLHVRINSCRVRKFRIESHKNKNKNDDTLSIKDLEKSPVLITDKDLNKNVNGRNNFYPWIVSGKALPEQIPNLYKIPNDNNDYYKNVGNLDAIKETQDPLQFFKQQLKKSYLKEKTMNSLKLKNAQNEFITNILQQPIKSVSNKVRKVKTPFTELNDSLESPIWQSLSNVKNKKSLKCTHTSLDNKKICNAENTCKLNWLDKVFDMPNKIEKCPLQKSKKPIKKAVKYRKVFYVEVDEEPPVPFYFGPFDSEGEEEKYTEEIIKVPIEPEKHGDFIEKKNTGISPIYLGKDFETQTTINEVKSHDTQTAYLGNNIEIQTKAKESKNSETQTSLHEFKDYGTQTIVEKKEVQHTQTSSYNIVNQDVQTSSYNIVNQNVQTSSYNIVHQNVQTSSYNIVNQDVQTSSYNIVNQEVQTNSSINTNQGTQTSSHVITNEVQTMSNEKKERQTQTSDHEILNKKKLIDTSTQTVIQTLQKQTETYYQTDDKYVLTDVEIEPPKPPLPNFFKEEVTEEPKVQISCDSFPQILRCSFKRISSCLQRNCNSECNKKYSMVETFDTENFYCNPNLRQSISSELCFPNFECIDENVCPNLYTKKTVSIGQDIHKCFSSYCTCPYCEYKINQKDELPMSKCS